MKAKQLSGGSEKVYVLIFDKIGEFKSLLTEFAEAEGLAGRSFTDPSGVEAPGFRASVG